MSLTSSLLASLALKDYTIVMRARARTPNTSHNFRILVLLAKASHPPFYSHKGSYWRTTRDAAVAAFTNAIMQILHTVQSHVSIQ